MANVSFRRAQAKFQPGLTGFTRGAGSGTFQYDPLGRRTRKIVSGTTRRFHSTDDVPTRSTTRNWSPAIRDVTRGLDTRCGGWLTLTAHG